MKFIAHLCLGLLFSVFAVAADSTTILFTFSGPHTDIPTYQSRLKTALRVISDRVSDGTIARYRVMNSAQNALDVCVTSYHYYTPTAQDDINLLSDTIEAMSSASFRVFTQKNNTQKQCEGIFPEGRN